MWGAKREPTTKRTKREAAIEPKPVPSSSAVAELGAEMLRLKIFGQGRLVLDAAALKGVNADLPIGIEIAKPRTLRPEVEQALATYYTFMLPRLPVLLTNFYIKEAAEYMMVMRLTGPRTDTAAAVSSAMVRVKRSNRIGCASYVVHKTSNAALHLLKDPATPTEALYSARVMCGAAFHEPDMTIAGRPVVRRSYRHDALGYIIAALRRNQPPKPKSEKEDDEDIIVQDRTNVVVADAVALERRARDMLLTELCRKMERDYFWVAIGLRKSSLETSNNVAGALVLVQILEDRGLPFPLLRHVLSFWMAPKIHERLFGLRVVYDPRLLRCKT